MYCGDGVWMTFLGVGSVVMNNNLSTFQWSTQVWFNRMAYQCTLQEQFGNTLITNSMVNLAHIVIRYKVFVIFCGKFWHIFDKVCIDKMQKFGANYRINSFRENVKPWLWSVIWKHNRIFIFSSLLTGDILKSVKMYCNFWKYLR